MNIFTGKDDEIVDPKRIDYTIVNIWDVTKRR